MYFSLNVNITNFLSMKLDFWNAIFFKCGTNTTKFNILKNLSFLFVAKSQQAFVSLSMMSFLQFFHTSNYIYLKFRNFVSFKNRMKYKIIVIYILKINVINIKLSIPKIFKCSNCLNYNLILYMRKPFYKRNVS